MQARSSLQGEGETSGLVNGVDGVTSFDGLEAPQRSGIGRHHAGEPITITFPAGSTVRCDLQYPGLGVKESLGAQASIGMGCALWPLCKGADEEVLIPPSTTQKCHSVGEQQASPPVQCRLGRCAALSPCYAAASLQAPLHGPPPP